MITFSGGQPQYHAKRKKKKKHNTDLSKKSLLFCPDMYNTEKSTKLTFSIKQMQHLI